MAFVGGSFLGVFGYAEVYPALAGFVNGSALGPIRVYDSVGLSQGLFACLDRGRPGRLRLHLLARAAAQPVRAFRVVPEAGPSPRRGRRPRPRRRAARPARSQGPLPCGGGSPEYQREHPARYKDADELAFRLLDRDPRLLVVDVRAEDAYRQMPLPASVNVPVRGLFGREWAPVLGRRHATRVFVDEDGSSALRGPPPRRTRGASGPRPAWGFPG